MTTTFVFIRHGEAAHNAAARLVGESAYMDPVYTDAPLNENGYMQAYDGRAALGTRGPFDIIYCSPLTRCMQTLRTIRPTATTQSVVLDDRLMEPQGSHICNRRAERADIVDDAPTLWDLSGIEEANPYDEWKAESIGHTSEHFIARIRAITEEIRQTHRGKRILIISHYRWIHAWFECYKHTDIHPANCQMLVATL